MLQRVPGSAEDDGVASPRRLQQQLLPGLPRWSWAVVLVAVAGELLVDLGGAVSGSTAVAVHWAGAAAVQVGVLGVLRWRARIVDGERPVWIRLARAARLGVAGVVGAGVLAAVLGTSSVTPYLLASTVGFPYAYDAVVRWNRYGTELAQPRDILNAGAAVLVLVGGLDLLARSRGQQVTSLTWWVGLPQMFQVATLVILVGSTAAVAPLAKLTHDPRVWLVMAGAALPMLAAVLDVLHTGGAGTSLWALGGLCVCAAASLPATPSTPQPTDPIASTVGAFAVVCAGTALLVTTALTRPWSVATALAALAVLAAALQLLAHVTDLSELAESRREALTDELTGLANRRAVLRALAEQCARPRTAVLALVDLDKFKEVNDGLGHSAGDDLLRLVAARLTGALDTAAVVGRLGGDEFCVVAAADTSDPRDLGRLGEQLLAAFTEPFTVGGLQLQVGASVGVSVRARTDSPADAATPNLLMRWADAAMYEAKRNGGGVAVHDATRHVDSSGQLALVQELRTGLRTGQLVLHHQPQVSCRTGTTIGVESLVRWEHPRRGLLYPADFLQLAEVHGLMGSLTEVVLVEAVRQAARWQAQGRQLRVSVNLSASNLLDAELPQRVDQLLTEHGVPARMLVLEVTESVLMSDLQRSAAVLEELAGLGVTVSIDDFGTGYASLTYLRALPMGELKLDRSFTADLLVDPRAAAIIASTVDLAHRLGLRVVAEGVEDEATLARLCALDCDESQGYLHARPLPADALERWLDERTVVLPSPRAAITTVRTPVS